MLLNNCKPIEQSIFQTRDALHLTIFFNIKHRDKITFFQPYCTNKQIGLLSTVLVRTVIMICSTWHIVSLQLSPVFGKITILCIATSRSTDKCKINLGAPIPPQVFKYSSPPL